MLVRRFQNFLQHQKELSAAQRKKAAFEERPRRKAMDHIARIFRREGIFCASRILMACLPAPPASAVGIFFGVTALRDGSMELSDGLQQLNDEGIQKISNLLGDDLDGLSTRLQAVVDVSRRYQNFSGISAEMDGTVKFIYRTDEICTDDGTK